MDERHARQFLGRGFEQQRTSIGRALRRRAGLRQRAAQVLPRDYETSYRVQEGYAADERIVDPEET